MTEELNLPQATRPDFFDSIEFNFRINSLTKKDIGTQSDVIDSIKWILVGKYNGITVEHACDVVFDDIQLANQSTFTNYNELTDEIVKSWVMTDNLLENIKCSIANKINLKLSKKEVVTNFPWQS